MLSNKTTLSTVFYHLIPCLSYAIVRFGCMLMYVLDNGETQFIASRTGHSTNIYFILAKSYNDIQCFIFGKCPFRDFWEKFCLNFLLFPFKQSVESNRLRFFNYFYLWVWQKKIEHNHQQVKSRHSPGARTV